MDFIKKAASGAKEGQQQDPNAQGGDKPDYVDKAFDFAAKKTGHNVDRNTEEKITDSGRGAYESVTGKKVNSKISN